MMQAELLPIAAVQECPECGKAFTPSRGHIGRQKFCSGRCQKRYGRRKARTDLECPHCGKAFTPYGRQKYCSRPCRDLAKYARRRAITAARAAERQCAHCGKAYLTIHPRKKYCTRQCCLDAQLTRERAARDAERQCAHCGKAFTRHGRQVYCSQRCRFAVRDKLNKERDWDGTWSVYIIWAPDIGMIKIGFARRPQRRFSDIGQMHGYPLELVMSLPFPDRRTARMVEGLVHSWVRVSAPMFGWEVFAHEWYGESALSFAKKELEYQHTLKGGSCRQKVSWERGGQDGQE